MENWEKALDKFISKWKDRKEVVGAIVCGSYITGNPSKHSDIDIQILLDKKTKWRERGNEIIDGILIEYFANPLVQSLKYQEEEYKKRSKTNIHMFLTGKVLFDKTWGLKTLIKKAKQWEKKKFKKTNKVVHELSKYHLWDMKDNLDEIYESNSEDFLFVYYNHLKIILEAYSSFLRYCEIPPHKVLRFLTSEKDKIKYRLDEFPDRTFVEKYIKAISLKDKSEMIKDYQELTDYVLMKMGGFNIDGWKVKSPAKTK